jgi:fumarate reductase flavoprotein subunit
LTKAERGTEQGQGGLPRRSFLSGAALVGVGTAFGLAGCSPQSSTSEPGASAPTGQATGGQATNPYGIPDDLPTEVSADAERLEYDVVVIGSGTSGTCAALAAAQNGARTIVIEKTDITGGLSNYSTFIAGAQTALQKEAGIDISVDYLYTAQREYYKGTCSLPLVRRIFETSAENIAWLTENGLDLIAFPAGLSVQSNLPRELELCGHMMTGANEDVIDSPYLPAGPFKGLWSTFLGQYGGEVMTETRAFMLMIGEDGQTVTGVACQRGDGTQVVINAKAVVLSAGSWNGDTDYFRYILARNPQYNQEATSSNSGDGILLAEKIGGHPWVSSPFWHQVYTSHLDTTEDYSLICRENTILGRLPAFCWVNTLGERFADESVTGDFSRMANTAFSQGGSYWLPISEAMVDDLEANGTPFEIIGSGPGDNTARTGTESISSAVGTLSGPMTGLKALMDEFVASGIYIKADSIEDLAAQTGCALETLQETFATYDAAVAAKQDAEFLKDSKFLVYSYGSGPFYAMRMTVNCEGGSLGGVRVNKNLKVIRRETGNPFDNLFATGLNAAGFFGVGGYADICGDTMGFATNSGRLAGTAAAALATG